MDLMAHCEHDRPRAWCQTCENADLARSRDQWQERALAAEKSRTDAREQHRGAVERAVAAEDALRGLIDTSYGPTAVREARAVLARLSDTWGQ